MTSNSERVQVIRPGQTCLGRDRWRRAHTVLPELDALLVPATAS